MSISATLYAANPLTPQAALAAAFPGYDAYTDAERTTVGTDVLDASARRQTKPNFDRELLGFESSISIYFVIDKWRTVEARQQLAEAVRNFLNRISGDVVVMYLDIIVLKRQDQDSICAIAYSDLLPNGGAGWTMVPELEQP